MVAGALVGFFLSLSLWWIQYRILVPRLAFSTAISRLHADDGVPVYRIKMQNPSRRRGIIDLSLDVRVYLGKGILTYAEGRVNRTSTSMRIHIAGNDHIMRIAPGTNRIVRLDLRPSRWSNVNPRLLESIGVDPSSDDPVALEALLGVARDGWLRVRVLAFDEFSGSRTYFESQRYYSDQIVRGKFHGLGVVPHVKKPEPR